MHLKYATVSVAQTSNEDILVLFPSTLCSGNEPGLICPHTHSLDVSLHLVVIVSPLSSQLHLPPFSSPQSRFNWSALKHGANGSF